MKNAKVVSNKENVDLSAVSKNPSHLPMLCFFIIFLHLSPFILLIVCLYFM